jgi:sugar lactone lactonase YvrE
MLTLSGTSSNPKCTVFLNDMNTVNENGKHAGRFLYRTHEVDEAGAVSFAKGDPSTAADVKVRAAVGLTYHEGIEIASDGSVFYINEFDGGSLYRFVPDHRDDLSSNSKCGENIHT